MAKHDHDAAMELLIKRHQQNKEKNIGGIIADTFVIDDMPDRAQKLIDVKDLYSSPKKWNFYEPLDDNKKLELMESIEDNGILSPIVVWMVDFEYVESEYSEDEVDAYDFDGNKYVILAGHNRADAFNKLYEATQDKKYLKIPAFIFEKDELDISEARSIVVDTNYVQRSLSTKEKVRSVLYKYAEIENRKDKKGRTKEIVAEELGLSPTMVLNYKRLGDIIEPLQNMVYEDRINLTSVLKLADKTKDTQQWIYDTYADVLTSKMLNKVKPSMKRAEIQNLFEKELQLKIKTKKVTVDVPEELVDEFKTMFSKWVYEKTKRV